MAQIINFPNKSERDWLDMEAELRETFRTTPDGPATFEECLPKIKDHWDEIFVGFSVQTSSQIPGPLTEEQYAAILAAIEKAQNLIADRLMSERGKYFVELSRCEFMVAYFRRNGETL